MLPQDSGRGRHNPWPISQFARDRVSYCPEVMLDPAHRSDLEFSSPARGLAAGRASTNGPDDKRRASSPPVLRTSGGEIQNSLP